MVASYAGFLIPMAAFIRASAGDTGKNILAGPTTTTESTAGNIAGMTATITGNTAEAGKKFRRYRIRKPGLLAGFFIGALRSGSARVHPRRVVPHEAPLTLTGLGRSLLAPHFGLGQT
jgi:hypothetical protein